MNVVLWIVAGLLALTFLGAGSMKLVQSKPTLLKNPMMAWAEDFSPATIKVIGSLEVLAAAGLILPAALDIAMPLTPIAASGLALLMAGAVVTHIRRKETAALGMPAVLLLLAALVAVCRFGPYSF